MLKLKNISKTYSTKDGVTHRALNNISLEFESKGLVFILGKSGSGKSTLLNIIGGLDSFDRGEIYLYEKKFSSFKSFEYDFYRNTFTGFVFQEFNLINELTIEENVTLALDLQSKKDQEKIDKIFKDCEISELKNRKTFELSGGQKQRVAIARALVKEPSIILADEPTGSLDTNTTKDIIDILVNLSKSRLVIVITHNRELAEQYGDRIIELKDGEIIKDFSNIETNDNEIYPSLIASSILKIPPKAHIRYEDIEKVNEILNSEKVDHYLSFETNQNKVKSMFPHLKEAISSTKEEKEKFKQYVYKEEANKDVKLIKSHLPFKRGLKFGFSNLKIKIPKLIFTIFLATLAISISACVDNFANYDEYKGITNSVVKDDYKYLKVKSAYSQFTDYSLKENDINKLNEINNAEVPLIYSKQIKITNYDLNWNYVASNSINSLIETDDITKYGYEYLIQSSNNYENNGLIISELVAREIAYTMNMSAIDVIDLPLELNNKECFIKGVYKCGDLSKYDILRNSQVMLDLDLLSEYNALYSDRLSQVFVDYGFIDYYKSQFDTLEEYSISMSFSEYENVFYGISLAKNNNNLPLETLNDSDGIYVPFDVLNSYMMMGNYRDLNEYVNYLNSNEIVTEIKKTYYDTTCFISNNLKIKGYVNSNSYVISEELFNKINDYTVPPTGAFINVENLNKTEVLNLVEKIYTSGFMIDESFVTSYENLVEICSLLEKLLRGVNTLVFTLAIILLFSFMLNSIKSNTKQIGILRAIGANVIDIIKIYIIEALIIGIISLLSSLIIYGVGGAIVNNVATTSYISLFTFGASTVFKMISSTLIVVILSLIIPIIRIAKMHPVDAIRND